MKTIKQTFLVVLFGILLLSNSSIAQEDKSYLITVTKLHWNMDFKDFSEDKWIATEKEYFDKVVKKNEFIVGQDVLLHLFTEDNTEILLISAYENWDAIEKAELKSNELIKAAWPDEKARIAYFDKKSDYYSGSHSDEIYATMPGAKLSKVNFDKEMLYYVRVSHFAKYKEGTDKEFEQLRKSHAEAVIYKNDFIKAYYPNSHAWGADNTEFTEVFVVETLADLDKALVRNGELYKENWKDEKARKEFSDKYGKYFTGVHGDYIYSSVPELSK